MATVDGNESSSGRPVLDRLTGRFIDPALEALYRAALRERNLRQTRLTIAVSVALNTAFAAVDPLAYSANTGTIVFLRLVLSNGVLLALIALSLVPYFRTRWPALLAAGSLLYTVFYATYNAIGDVAEVAAGGYLLVVLVIYVLLPFHFLHGVITGWACSLIYVGAAAAATDLPAFSLVTLALQVLAANVIGMYALYRAERFLRLDFANLRTIEAERGRYRDLLGRILPRAIAERLQGGEREIADTFADSSVLFADIVGFTSIAAATSPRETLEFLNRVFAAFDGLVARHGLEKIKTIGDSYMVAGGLAGGAPDHLGTMAELALDMLEAVRGLRAPGDAAVRIRVGIHSGPLVAGVIGESRFLYDLWGDTVNIASRMETAGAPGRIQVSQEVRDRLAERYAFEPRGEVEVKGKGPLATWYLTGRIVGASGPKR